MIPERHTRASHREAPVIIPDGPCATLRVAAERLDPEAVSRILLQDGRQDFVVKGKPGLWMASTEHLASRLAEDHLAALTRVMTERLADISRAYPDVRIDFSLLSFDPAFYPGQLPPALVAAATAQGTFVIELAVQGTEIVMTRNSVESFPA